LATHRIPLPFEVDVRTTLGPLRRGSGDPTCRFATDGFWRATRTPEGPATLRLLPVARDEVEVEAWGPGAELLIDGVPDLLGGRDDPASFAPDDPLLQRLHHGRPGFRIGRSGSVYEALVPTVLEQRVTGFEARRSYQQLVRRTGEPAPGPGGFLLPPNPEIVAGLPYYELHVLGVERGRADTLRRVAAHAERLDATAALPLADAYERITALPGVGIWSAAEVGRVALGDADAVSVGDYHVKHQVAFALAGERRATDERMLELLEPYAGHRGRVQRLIELARLGPPRRAPRARIRSIATQ
jgi:3-methyladenine DNA glycosylase/8-oxoguanine DNA glycosylase